MNKKILVSIMVIILLTQCFMPLWTVKGYEIDSANIVKIGSAEYHLKYYNESKQMYTYIICSIVGYYRDNKFYPAYCMNSSLPGAETVEYSVNINSLINREDVWRVVTNGYPYKTPEQMGVDNDFDAFVVTKMAVYCIIGQSQIEKFSYDANDDRAHRMYDALINLVNIGNDSSIKRKDGLFSVEKSGDLEECGEYFGQKYEINQDSNMETYEVTSLEGFPDGSFISNENNNPQNVFENGEMFKILIPKSGFTSEINGDFKVLTNMKTYPVFYGEAPSGYQNYIVTFDYYQREEKNVELYIEEPKGNVKILKKDKDSQEMLKGVTFELYDENMNLLETLQTDESGQAISDFYPSINRKYYLKETQCKEGYVLNEELIEIRLINNETFEIVIENEKIPEPEPEPPKEEKPIESEPTEPVEPQKITQVSNKTIIILPPAKKLPKTGM